MAVGMIFGAVVVGIVGLGLWRASYSAFSRAEPPVRTGQLALALGAGSLGGRPVSFNSPAGWNQPVLTFAVTVFGLSLIWAFATALVVWLVLRWIAVSAASSWPGSVARVTSARRSYLVALIAAAGMLALCFSAMLPVESISEVIELENGLGTVLLLLAVLAVVLLPLLLAVATILPGPAITAALFSVWAFPLGLAVRGGQVGAAQRLRATVLTAIATAIVGGVLTFVRFNSWRQEVPRGTATDAEKLDFFVTVLVVALLAQMVASAFAAARARSVLHGLCAAFVTGCVLAVTILVAVGWDGIG